MIRVLIVDDHEIVRRGLREILSEEEDIEFAGEAENGECAIARLREQPGYYDVVLLDVAMDGKDGIDILRQIRKEFPSQIVLMLSMYVEGHYAVQALKQGAAGYLNKCSASDDLVAAIREVANGGRYITDAVAKMLAFSLSGAGKGPPHEYLSHREYQTFMLIVSGEPLTKIAEKMGVSVKTVSVYRLRLLEKMRLKNNTELIHYAMQHRLLDLNCQPGEK